MAEFAIATGNFNELPLNPFEASSESRVERVASNAGNGSSDDGLSLIEFSDTPPRGRSEARKASGEELLKILNEFDMLRIDAVDEPADPKKNKFSEDLFQLEQGFRDDDFDDATRAESVERKFAVNRSSDSSDTDSNIGITEPEIIHIIALEMDGGEDFKSPLEGPTSRRSGLKARVVTEEDINSVDQIPPELRKIGKEDFADHTIHPRLGTISVKNTTVGEFNIRNVNGPGYFHMQNTTELGALDKLEKEMTTWYTDYFWEKHMSILGPEKMVEGRRDGWSFEHMQFEVEDGGFYAAFVPSLKRWCRCTAENVAGFGAENDVLVSLLDHGIQCFVALHMILPLRRVYLELPIQSYCGNLHGLDETKTRVPPTLVKKFREETEGQRFLVLIMDTQPTYSSLNKVLSVVILTKVDMWIGQTPFTGFPAPVFVRTDLQKQ